MSKADMILNRISRGLDGDAITNRPHTIEERRDIVRRAEIAIDDNWDDADLRLIVSHWFAARLSELELA